MNRRKYLSMLGAGPASVFAVGTGAFSSTKASRAVSVKIAKDANALLKLDALGEGGQFGGRSTDPSEGKQEVAFTFPGVQRRLDDPSLGLGTDSVYEFDRDTQATGPKGDKGLLAITNQGTQPVSVLSQDTTNSNVDIELYDVTDKERQALRDNPPTIRPGNVIKVGFRISTLDAEVKTFDETLTIIAERPEGRD